MTSFYDKIISTQPINYGDRATVALPYKAVFSDVGDGVDTTTASGNRSNSDDQFLAISSGLTSPLTADLDFGGFAINHLDSITDITDHGVFDIGGRVLTNPSGNFFSFGGALTSTNNSKPQSVYAAGTAYSLTESSAALDFGTTDPSIVLDKVGRYMIFATVNLKYNGATFAASRTVTLKLRRTNNTAADLTNGTRDVATAIVTTVTQTFGVFNLPPILYSTENINDIITIFGIITAVPTVGSLDAVEASILAVRIF